MSEIYKNTSQEVYLDIYGGTASTPVAVLTTPTTTKSLPVSFGVAEGGVEERYVANLSMADTQNEGEIKIVWTFEIDGEVVTKTDYFSVVTPILTFGEIKKIHPHATDEEVHDVEAAVRHIIESHTGQTFGRFDGIKEVKGDGSRALPLPSRLFELKSISGFEHTNKYFFVDTDGWYLRNFPWGVPPIKADYYGLHQHSNGVIHNPNSVKLGQFMQGRVYEIDGSWGWERVPSAVKEAAKLLVNDYACGDIQYRDRYLVSMTAADWRIQYHAGAYLNTGNVRADQLLSDFVVHNWSAL